MKYLRLGRIWDYFAMAYNFDLPKNIDISNTFDTTDLTRFQIKKAHIYSRVSPALAIPPA